MSKFEASFEAGGGCKVTITHPDPPWTQEYGKIVSDYFFKGPKIMLNNGIEISLQGVKQSLTYGSLLEGIPWGPHHQGYVNSQIRWFKEECNRYGNDNPRFVLIEPEVLSLPVSEEICASMQSFYGIEPISIGPVACRGRFECNKAVRGADVFGGSELTIIWFQTEFMAPMPEYVVNRIREIDWEAEADNFEL